jgi:hypothetical protein
MRQKRPAREISAFASLGSFSHCSDRRAARRLPRGRAPAARAIPSARLNSATPAARNSRSGASKSQPNRIAR